MGRAWLKKTISSRALTREIAALAEYIRDNPPVPPPNKVEYIGDDVEVTCGFMTLRMPKEQFEIFINHPTLNQE